MGASVQNPLKGKRVLIHGRAAWSRKELARRAAAFGATAVKKLDAKTDYLVLLDSTGTKGVQGQAAGLNAGGAAIQVMEEDDFKKLLTASDEGLLAMIRAGNSAMYEAAVEDEIFHYQVGGKPRHHFVSENFEKADLREFDFSPIFFTGCNLRGARVAGSVFSSLINCDLSGCDGTGAVKKSRTDGGAVQFAAVTGSKFIKARLPGAQIEGDVQGADFTSAVLDGATFDSYRTSRARSKGKPPVFSQASMRGADLSRITWRGAIFDGADLSKAILDDCDLAGASFRNAVLQGAAMSECKLAKADFRDADLRGVNFADADLSGADFAGANLESSNLRGAKLDGADLGKARNVPVARAVAAESALAELDKVAAKARKIEIAFRVEAGRSGNVEINTGHIKYNCALKLPSGFRDANNWQSSGKTLSAVLLEAAHHLGKSPIKFETLRISASKSPKTGAELRDLMLRGMSEAFEQPLPAEADLSKKAGAFLKKEKAREKVVAQRQEAARKKAVARVAQKRESELKKLEEKAGKVSDVATFHKALEVRVDLVKLKKASSMLKASKFQLFSDVTGEFLSGVVKSQTDADLVYACRLAKDGKYACCTQNLNICGGLRGSVCKHLLVLIIGLVQAGQLDPAVVDGWIAHTHEAKPELDKEVMGEIFIKYKGAEAGEVDWRPVETLPEDYYAV